MPRVNGSRAKNKWTEGNGPRDNWALTQTEKGLTGPPVTLTGDDGHVILGNNAP